MGIFPSSILRCTCFAIRKKGGKKDRRQAVTFAISEQNIIAGKWWRHCLPTPFPIMIRLWCKSTICNSRNQIATNNYERGADHNRCNVGFLTFNPISSSPSWPETWSCCSEKNEKGQVAHLRSCDKAGKSVYPSTPTGSEQVKGLNRGPKNTHYWDAVTTERHKICYLLYHLVSQTQKPP